MTYKTVTAEQFLADARAWDLKRRAMRRAVFLNSIFDAFMGVFALAFLALSFLVFAGPGVLALAAFFGIMP